VQDDDEDLWQLFHPAGRHRGRADREQRIHDHLQRHRDRRPVPPGRASSLSREEIVRAAIAVADAEGTDAISMRRIAKELRSGTMSLYWHVDNKDNLLDLMLDAVEGEAGTPTPTGDWRADLRSIALNQRAVLLRHQWLMDFIGGRPPLGPNTLRNMESSMGAIDKLKLDTATALNVLSTLQTYVIGAVLREFREIRLECRDQEQLAEAGLSEADAREIMASHFERLRRTGRFPHFVRIFDEDIDPDAAETRDERFEFGLDCVLDGIAARLPASSG
jgi:AcrR family transcriptional regulator